MWPERRNSRCEASPRTDRNARGARRSRGAYAVSKLTLQSRIESLFCECAHAGSAQFRQHSVIDGFSCMARFSATVIPATIIPNSAFMSDRDKAGLRGPVKTVIEEQTFPGADGRQPFTTTTTTRYAPSVQILEARMGNLDDPGWTTSYTYSSDGLPAKIASGNASSDPAVSETTYLYDDAQRLVGAAGDKVQVHYRYDDKGRKSVIENYDSQPLAVRARLMREIGKERTLDLLQILAALSPRRTTGRGWRRRAEFRDAEGKLRATLCESSTQQAASLQNSSSRMLRTISCSPKSYDQTQSGTA